MKIQVVHTKGIWWVVADGEPVSSSGVERGAKYDAKRLARIHGLKRTVPDLPGEDYMPIAAWETPPASDPQG